MLSFYVALAVLWLVLIGAGYLVLGRDVFRLFAGARAAAGGVFHRLQRVGVPKLMEQLGGKNSASKPG